MSNRRVTLSTLWIFAIFNYLYADILTLMDPAHAEEMAAVAADGLQLTEGMLLAGAVLMETAIAMVVLSRLLRYSANRWANIAAGAIHTVAVSASLFVGTATLYYLFFAAVEIATTLFIIWYAWTWPKPAMEPGNAA